MSASGEKPYRVYRGGRQKGKVPVSGGGGPDRRKPSDGKLRRQRKPWTWRRWTLLTLVVLVVLIVIWGAAGYLTVSSGVSDANKRLPPGTTSALTSSSGLILDSPTNILLLGTDHATNGQAGRNSDNHSDSMMLVRTDPSRHRITYLSIPRDLFVHINGLGEKINAAMQFGGPKLAIQTVDDVLGSQLMVNHVVLVDFEQFQKLIDAVGGIDVNVPEAILSNRFDCPYSTAARCEQWQGWRFHKGLTHMNGHTALIYSRIRENRLDPSWTDFKRQQNQQAVMQATLAKLSTPTRFFSLPFNGSDLLAPIATDLSTWDFMQLGWVKFRAGNVVHCRLGGSTDGGYINPTEEDIQVVQEVLGNSAPQPPAPGTGPFGPGCVVGNQQFK